MGFTSEIRREYLSVILKEECNFLNFLFYIGGQPVNSVASFRCAVKWLSHTHTRVSCLPQTPLPSRLPLNTEQSSLCLYSRTLWIIYSKQSSVVMLIPTSLPILSPYPSLLVIISSFCKSVKEEDNWNQLHISSMASCKRTMALAWLSHSGFEVHLPACVTLGKTKKLIYSSNRHDIAFIPKDWSEYHFPILQAYSLPSEPPGKPNMWDSVWYTEGIQWKFGDS